MARCVLYDAVWVGGPGPNRHGVVGAWDDGCLRGLELAPAHWATDPKNPWVSLVAGGWVGGGVVVVAGVGVVAVPGS